MGGRAAIPRDARRRLGLAAQHGDRQDIAQTRIALMARVMRRFVTPTTAGHTVRTIGRGWVNGRFNQSALLR